MYLLAVCMAKISIESNLLNKLTVQNQNQKLSKPKSRIARLEVHEEKNLQKYYQMRGGGARLPAETVKAGTFPEASRPTAHSSPFAAQIVEDSASKGKGNPSSDPGD